MIRLVFSLFACAIAHSAGFAGEIHAILLDSGHPGPTVVVIAPEGGAGSAGIDAVHQLQYTPPSKGRLVLAESVADFSVRTAPQGWETIKEFSELEKRFPKHHRLVFRESIDSWSYVDGATGETVQGNGPGAEAMLKALRGLPSPEGRNWAVVAGDGDESTQVITTNAKENLDAGLRLSVRQREFRTAANALLRHLGMMDGQPVTTRLFPESLPGVTRIAVYDDGGALNSTGHGPAWIRANLMQRQCVLVEVVGAAEICEGALDRADALVIGGGRATPQTETLGEKGRESIRTFVRNGGGFVGICAGACVGSRETKSWHHIGLLPVKIEGTAGGQYFPPLAWAESPAGPARTEKAELHGGPKFTIPEGVEGIDVWASFIDDITESEKKVPIAGTPAVVSGTFGKGRVVLFSTHCERRPTPSALFPATVLWTAKKTAATPTP